MLRVLVDDVRRFVDERPCVVYRNSADAICGLREMAQAGTVVDELWLDHDLGGRDRRFTPRRTRPRWSSAGRESGDHHYMIAAGVDGISLALARLGAFDVSGVPATPRRTASIEREIYGDVLFPSVRDWLRDEDAKLSRPATRPSPRPQRRYGGTDRHLKAD
jgi:hypothetical protein